MGASRWKELSVVYDQLASHRDPKVRKGLASAIHEVATILGCPKTEECLLDFFRSFLNDDHESVKVCVIRSLHVFLKNVSQERLGQLYWIWRYLYDLHNSSVAWRLRKLVARQIGDLAILFNLSVESFDGIVFPLLLALVGDPVAVVRMAAQDQFVKLFHYLYREDRKNMKTTKMKAILSSFSYCEKYNLRESYIQILGSIFNLGFDVVVEKGFKEELAGFVKREQVPYLQLLAQELLVRDVKSQEGNL
eukprot:TRINITY_DN5606_c0_g1_i2.p1 TRINITY_DN5606_c0_g1~~TRINITY_DN5606_c0_g1_i2.p1  ORF type:complete len:249 (-),score=53.36 TRINITY_DN5606_c0_g1_i2:73-819(-)